MLLALMSLSPFLIGSSDTVELTPVTREMFFTKMPTEGDVIIDAGALGEYRFSEVSQTTDVSQHNIIRQELLDFLNEIQLLFKEPIKIEIGYRSPEQHIYQWANWLSDNPSIIKTLNDEKHASWEAWVKASQGIEGCPHMQSKHQTGDAVTFIRTNKKTLSDAGRDLLIEHLREIGGTREYTDAERTLYDIPNNENSLFNIVGIVNGQDLQFHVEYVPSKTPTMPNIDQIGEENNITVVKPPPKRPIFPLTPVTREMFFTKMPTEGDVIIDAGALGKYRFSEVSQTPEVSQHNIIRQELVDFLNEIQLLFKEPIIIEVGYRSPEQHIYKWAKWLQDNPDIVTTLNDENHESWEAWINASTKFEGCPPQQSKHQTGDAVTFIPSSEKSLTGAGRELLVEHLREIGGTREYTDAERTLYDIPNNEKYLFNIVGTVNGQDLQFHIEYVRSKTPPMPNINQIGKLVSKPTPSPIPKPETDLWLLTNPESSFHVTLRGNSTSYHVDGTIMFQTESSENVYIILLKWDVNNALTVLMPNTFRDDNFVRVDMTDTIPNKDDDYILELSGQPGTERYKVIALLRMQDNQKILDIFRNEAESPINDFWHWEDEKSKSIALEVSAALDQIAPDNWAEHSLTIKVQEAAPPELPEDLDNSTHVDPSEASTALLNVTSKPSGARITVDGKIIGITPMRAYEINMGNTRKKQINVTLSYEGYQDSEKSITLEKGETATWKDVEMKRTTQAPPGVQTTKMVLIPAGTFMMGSDQFVGEDTKPIHSVYLNDYYIDEHEVTVGQYREFIEKTGHEAPPWKTVAEVSPTDNHPMIGISWHDAMAYALWVGKRLPTEAEWEKAARGGHIGKNYPWGTDEIDASLAHFGDKSPLTQPVKSYPANAYGLYDMAGNVSERCLDPWDPTFYGRSPVKNPFPGSLNVQETVDNYKNIQGKRVTRGGSYAHSMEVCEVGARTNDDAKSIYINIGFRCVKDVSP